VAAKGCEARRSPRECESELTTGWDRWDGHGWALSALSLDGGWGSLEDHEDDDHGGGEQRVFLKIAFWAGLERM
jgi:hypothetical protein